jgi:hypothetical protein
MRRLEKILRIFKLVEFVDKISGIRVICGKKKFVKKKFRGYKNFFLSLHPKL